MTKSHKNSLSQEQQQPIRDLLIEDQEIKFTISLFNMFKLVFNPPILCLSVSYVR